jgi:hypothetical protein
MTLAILCAALHFRDPSHLLRRPSASSAERMPDQVRPDTSVEVTSRLRAAFLARPVDEVELKSAVSAYVDDAKAVGWPVERVIIFIKRIAEVEQSAKWSSDPMKRSEAQHLLARAVTWCVQHYYWSD